MFDPFFQLFHWSMQKVDEVVADLEVAGIEVVPERVADLVEVTGPRSAEIACPAPAVFGPLFCWEQSMELLATVKEPDFEAMARVSIIGIMNL